MNDPNGEGTETQNQLENKIKLLSENESLRSALREAREALEQLKRDHYVCDDCWYSCPLSDDGCCDDDVPEDECNCGASEHNARIEKAITKLNALEGE